MRHFQLPYRRGVDDLPGVRVHHVDGDHGQHHHVPLLA